MAMARGRRRGRERNKRTEAFVGVHDVGQKNQKKLMRAWRTKKDRNGMEVEYGTCSFF
jgi:hypothetical protein